MFGDRKAEVSRADLQLQMLVSRISQLVSRRKLLPEVTEQILRPRFEHLERDFVQMLDAFAECFRQGDCRREFPTVDGALTAMDRGFQEIRDRNLLRNMPPEVALRVLELVDLYYASADALGLCGKMLRALRIERYWGDYAL